MGRRSGQRAAPFLERNGMTDMKATTAIITSSHIGHISFSLYLFAYDPNVSAEVVRDPRPRGFENHLQHMVRKKLFLIFGLILLL